MLNDKNYIDFLFKTANQFLELTTDDNLYLTITDQLLEILPNSIIIISSVDEHEKFTSVESISGLNENLEKILEFISGDIIGSKFEISEDSRKELYRGKLIMLDGGIHQLSFKKINKKISKAIEKILSINAVYGIGFVTKNRLVATFSIILRASDTIDNEKIIETYVSQASSAIYRFNSEKKLQESQSKFKYLFENINDIYYESTIDGNIELISPSFSRITNYTNSDINFFKISDYYVNPEDRLKLLEELKKNKSVKDYEIQLKGKNNHIIDFSVSANMLFDKEGKPIKIIGSLRDISARKEVERTLKDVISTKDKFFSIISHDLRSPLSGFIGLTRTLVEDYDSLESKEIKEISETLLNSAIKVYQLLENLLNWSKIQQDKIILIPREIYLKEVIENVLMLNLQSANNKQIKIFNLSKSNDKVYCDKESLETILRNIISNAIKFSYPSGEIIIRVEHYNSEFVQVVIEDNGIGIEEPNISKLFNPEAHYYRQGTNGESSSGIGLILCNELVKKNKGSIKVESQINKGTKFIIILPEFSI